MHKTWVVGKREFNIQIRKLSFWLTTFGLPIFMFLIGLIMAGFALWSITKTIKKKDRPQNLPFGFVDTASLVSLDILDPNEETKTTSPFDDPDVKKIMDSVSLPKFVEEKMEAMVAETAESVGEVKNPKYQMFESVAAAEAALTEKEIRGYLHLPDGFPLENPGEIVWLDRKHDMRTRRIERHLRNQLLAQNYDAETIPVILQPLNKVDEQYRFEVEKKKEDKDWGDFDLKALGLPMVFAFAMLMVVMFSSDRLLRGLMEEKQNRVIEILLSSVSADQLMAGKVFGIGAIGLVQLTIWTVLMFLPASSMLTFFSISVLDLGLYLVFFLLGYFLLSTLMLGLGSIGNTFQEASQWSLVVSLLALSPLFVWPMLFQDMDSTLVHVFTYFPFTSPLMVMIRHGAGMISTGQILTCFGILVVSNIFAIKFGAKLFRLGILLTGKTPSPLTVWKMFRAS